MLLQPCKVCLNRSQMACFTHNLHIGLTQCVYTSCAPAMPNRQTCATNNKVYWYRHEMRECINFSEITVILTWRFYVGCIIPKCLGYYTFMLLPHEHTLCARPSVMFQRQKQNACICAQSDFACLSSAVEFHRFIYYEYILHLLDPCSSTAVRYGIHHWPSTCQIKLNGSRSAQCE
jgi:hypothetical protein